MPCASPTYLTMIRLPAHTCSGIPTKQRTISTVPVTYASARYARTTSASRGSGSNVLSSSLPGALAQAVPSAVALDLAAELGQVGVVLRELLVVLTVGRNLGFAGGQPVTFGRRPWLGALAGSRFGAGGQHDLAGARPVGGRAQFIPDRLHPEHDAEDREDRPFERISPAQRVACHGATELPVAEPRHAEHRRHGEEVPAEPPGRQQDPPARGGRCVGHDLRLAPPHNTTYASAANRSCERAVTDCHRRTGHNLRHGSSADAARAARVRRAAAEADRRPEGTGEGSDPASKEPVLAGHARM